MGDKYTFRRVLEEMGNEPEEITQRLQLLEDMSYDSLGSSILDARTNLVHFLKQAEGGPQINLNANVLLISDRLYGQALALHYFIDKYTTATVSGIATGTAQALEILKNKPVSVIVYVGYQRDLENYKVIEFVKKSSTPIPVVMWAVLDGFVREQCARYRIRHAFDRQEKNGHEFAEYLRKVVV